MTIVILSFAGTRRDESYRADRLLSGRVDYRIKTLSGQC